MAGKDGTLRIRVLGDISDFTKNMSSAAGELQKFGSRLQTVGRDLTLIAAPIALVGGAAVKMGLDFDTTLRRIVGLTDVTQEQIGGIRDELIRLGPEVGKSPQELADAFYFVASAGFQAEEAMDVLTVAAKASAAGMGEAEDIAKALGGAINAYGKENLSAADAGDILTAAVGKGSAEAADYAGVLGNVVNSAALLGVSFDQTTAAISAMTNVSIGADEAVTSLNQVLLSLLNPTTQAQEALAGMELSAEGLRRQLREEGLLSVLRTLEERFEGNDEAAGQVFGNVRALRGVLSLLGLDAEQLNDIFAATASATGNLGQAFADTEGAQRDLDRATAELQGALILLSEDILPVVVEGVRGLAGMARDLAAWWKTLDQDTQSLIVHVGLLAVALGPLLIVIGSIARAVGSLIELFALFGKGIAKVVPHVTTLTAALWAKVSALAASAGGWLALLGPIALVTAGIAAIIALVWGSVDAFNEGRRSGARWGEEMLAAKAAADAAGEEFDVTRYAIDGLAEAVRTRGIFGFALFTGQLWGTADAASETGDAFGDMVRRIQTGVAEMVGAIKARFDEIGRFLSGLGAKFGAFKDQVVNSIRQLAADIVKPIKDALDWIGQLNPFVRHSPSLVDNVMAGVAEIRRQYESLSGLRIDSPHLDIPKLEKVAHSTIGRIRERGDGDFSAGLAALIGSQSQTYNIHGLQLDDVERAVYKAQRRLALEMSRGA